MLTRRALVVGAGIAELATAFRLRRSDWEVVLLHEGAPPRDVPLRLRGADLGAARRLGLESPLRPQDLADGLHDVAVEHDVQVSALVTDDCGVTVTFSTGRDDWFDLVVGGVESAGARIVHFSGAGQDVLYAAELLGDAFDIFPDATQAARWWEEQLRTTGVVRRRAGFGAAVVGSQERSRRVRVRARAPRPHAEWT